MIRPPDHVIKYEAAILYRYMVFGQAGSKAQIVIYLDPRNQIIYDSLFHLKKQIGVMANSESRLIRYLKEFNRLESAGGREYIHFIFGGYEKPPLFDWESDR